MKKSDAPPLILTSNGLFLEFKSTAYGESNIRFSGGIRHLVCSGGIRLLVDSSKVITSR